MQTVLSLLGKKKDGKNKKRGNKSPEISSSSSASSVSEIHVKKPAKSAPKKV